MIVVLLKHLFLFLFFFFSTHVFYPLIKKKLILDSKFKRCKRVYSEKPLTSTLHPSLKAVNVTSFPSVLPKIFQILLIRNTPLR